MTENNFFSEGIVAYYKGSLAFSIIENRLLLEGGSGYDDEGTLLSLSKSAYVVLENIDLVEFENHKCYYFYMCQRKNLHKMENCEKKVELEEELTFCMTQQKQHSGLFLGEVSIDYDEAEGKYLSIAENAFYPGKNQIDIRAVQKYSVLASPVNQAQKLKMSQILFALSESLYQSTRGKQNIELLPLVTAFFQFSDFVQSQSFSPFTLYQKFESHVKLFSWIDFSLYSEEAHTIIQRLESLFLDHKRTYKTDFYYLELEEESSFFCQLLRSLEQLTQVLKKEDIRVEKVQSIPIPVEKTVEKQVPEPMVFDNVTVIEKRVDLETSDEDENSTVLLNGEYKTSIQVGRGLQSGNDIILGESDKTVSRIHLKISPHKQGFFLEDLSSMGTYVDGIRLEKNIKKFVTARHVVTLGKKECSLDLSDFKIQALASV